MVAALGNYNIAHSMAMLQTTVVYSDKGTHTDQHKNKIKNQMPVMSVPSAPPITLALLVTLSPDNHAFSNKST
jgi:hypothetical protein